MNHPNGGNRASLLSGLRTGGVRSASGPIMPHTAAPGGGFNIPRYPSGSHAGAIYEDDMDYGQSIQYSAPAFGVPMTAGLDGRAPRFQQTQSAGFNQQQQMMMRQAQLASMGGMGQINTMEAQLQMQMMQAMAIQQQQNLQAQIALQQQAALNIAQKQQYANKPPVNRVPASAAPGQSTFDLRSNAIAQLRGSRFQNTEEKENDLGTVPMSAALGGRFGSRSMPNGFNPNAAPFKSNAEQEYAAPPQTPASSTVVISGGVSLGGSSAVNTPTSATGNMPSKSDSAVSWRRPSMASSPSMGRIPSPPKSASPPSASPPRVTISTPEETDRLTPSNSTAQLNSARGRPHPLTFSVRAAQIGVPNVSIDATEYNSERSNSPSSPESSGVNSDVSRKYEGVGMGRPRAPSGSTPAAPMVRVSQPVRQPRGPPASVDDFGSQNFAARLKRGVPPPLVVEAY